jgi:hypothetical protein
MEEHDPKTERRQYPRIRAPILWRPVGPLTSITPLIDISLGGLRVYSDEPYPTGEPMEIEVFLRDRRTVTALVEVAWCRELPEDSHAPYDIGLQFVDLSPEGFELLSTVLDLEEKDQTPT